MSLNKLRTSFLVAFIATCLFTTGCQLEQKTSHPSYSYKNKKNPKFINGITMGGHGQTAINLDDVVEENDNDDVADASANNYTYNAPTLPKKSNIKVKIEDAEPSGLKPPVTPVVTGSLTNSVTKTVITVTKSVTQTLNNIQQKYAEMLGILPTSICNASLYQFIDEWYGVSYHFGGTTKNGIDCSAFVQQLYEHVFGTNLLRTAIEQFATSSFTKKATGLQEGDLVFFHIHSRHITHVGIYLANNFFVHASRSQGVTISNLNDSYWRKYYAGAGKVNKDDKYSVN